MDLNSDSRESRISDGAGGYIHSPKLAAQDVKVGGFYLTNHDDKGAYDRFKEATRVDPEERPTPLFGLAEAARGLKLKGRSCRQLPHLPRCLPRRPKG